MLLRCVYLVYLKSDFCIFVNNSRQNSLLEVSVNWIRVNVRYLLFITDSSQSLILCIDSMQLLVYYRLNLIVRSWFTPPNNSPLLYTCQGVLHKNQGCYNPLGVWINPCWQWFCYLDHIIQSPEPDDTRTKSCWMENTWWSCRTSINYNTFRSPSVNLFWDGECCDIRTTVCNLICIV